MYTCDLCFCATVAAILVSKLLFRFVLPKFANLFTISSVMYLLKNSSNAVRKDLSVRSFPPTRDLWL